jgi:hypothetical protein
MWHLPNLLFGGWTTASYALWLALTIATSFIYTWVFNNTGGSILIAALLHATINKGSGLTMGLVPGLEDELALYGAIALAFGVAAVAVVVATRGRLGYRAQGEPPEAPSRAQRLILVRRRTARALSATRQGASILDRPTAVPKVSRRNTDERGIMRATASTDMDYRKISTKRRQTPLRGACA